MDLEVNAPVATPEGPIEVEPTVDAGASNVAVVDENAAVEAERAEGASKNGRGRNREGRNGRGSRRNRDGGREGRTREYAEEPLEPRPDVGPALIVAELETMPEEQMFELAREYEI